MVNMKTPNLLDFLHLLLFLRGKYEHIKRDKGTHSGSYQEI